ncbi:MAG: VOC family protein [Dehalococcoidales bacterium]
MFKGIEHVELVSSNMDRTLKFYTEILGFTIQFRRKTDRQPMEEIAFIELGGTLIEVLGVNAPAPVSTQQWQNGWRRIAIEVEDMDKAIAYLNEKGVKVSQEPVVTETSVMSEIKDTDGIAIQLIQRK